MKKFLVLLLIGCAHAQRELPREEVIIPGSGFGFASSMAEKMILAQPTQYALQGLSAGFSGVPGTVTVATGGVTSSCIGFGFSRIGETCINAGSWTVGTDATNFNIYYGNQVRMTGSQSTGQWTTSYRWVAAHFGLGNMCRFPVILAFIALVTGDCGSFQAPGESLQCRDAWMEPQYCDARGWNESNPLNPR